MSSRFRQALSVVLLVSGIFLAAGCSSDTVNSGSQDLTVAVTPNPAGTGRYEEASVIVNKIQVLPADPATAALYGGDALILFFSPTDVDLATSTDEFISHISLSPGTYNVSFLEITPVVLVDDNVSPTPVTCMEGIEVIDGTRPPGIPSTFGFASPPSLTFTVHPGQTKLALKINIPGLIAGYEGSYTCTLGCGPGGSPCLTGFSEPAYRAALLANMQFE